MVIPLVDGNDADNATAPSAERATRLGAQPPSRGGQLLGPSHQNPLNWLKLLLNLNGFTHNGWIGAGIAGLRGDLLGRQHRSLYPTRNIAAAVIPHGVPGTSRTPIRLLGAMGLPPLGRAAVVMFPSRPLLALQAGGLTAFFGAIPTAWLAATAVVEKLAAPLAAAAEENVTGAMLSMSHPRVEPTKSRHRHQPRPQSARDKAEPPAGRPGPNPGRPSRLLPLQLHPPAGATANSL